VQQAVFLFFPEYSLTKDINFSGFFKSSALIARFSSYPPLVNPNFLASLQGVPVTSCHISETTLPPFDN
jgi:hypothetical protein